MKLLKKILKLMGAGMIVTLLYHESKTLFEIKKENLKQQHWLKKNLKK